MLHSATDLMRYKAVVEGSNLPITDLFFNPSLSVVSHFVVGTSILPWADRAAVSSQHSGTPDPQSRAIGLAVTKDMVAAAPSVDLRPTKDSAAEQANKAIKDEDMSDGDRLELVYERASKWLKAPVSHETSEVVGHVEDFLIDWPQGRISHAVVKCGEALPLQQVVVPHSEYEVPCYQEPSIRLTSDLGQLVDKPNLEAMELVDRHWIDTLRSSLIA